jgi:hypothetical protein
MACNRHTLAATLQGMKDLSLREEVPRYQAPPVQPPPPEAQVRPMTPPPPTLHPVISLTLPAHSHADKHLTACTGGRSLGVGLDRCHLHLLQHHTSSGLLHRSCLCA